MDGQAYPNHVVLAGDLPPAARALPERLRRDAGLRFGHHLLRRAGVSDRLRARQLRRADRPAPGRLRSDDGVRRRGDLRRREPLSDDVRAGAILTSRSDPAIRICTRIWDCTQVVTCIDGQAHQPWCGLADCDKPLGPCEIGLRHVADVRGGHHLLRGRWYPTTCGPANCDEPLGPCETECDPTLACDTAITCFGGVAYLTGSAGRRTAMSRSASCLKPVGRLWLLDNLAHTPCGGGQTAAMPWTPS